MKELDANKFFYVFELMFETKHTQLVDEALKCIHVSLEKDVGSNCGKIHESIQRSYRLVKPFANAPQGH